MTQRSGAPDPHAEMRGVVMLAASNEAVGRLNDAAQAVRAATGEVGPEHVYPVAAGRQVRLREGDHVLLRINDRDQRMHEGTDVLNGYRGVVEGIDASTGAVHVAWQSDAADGHRTERAELSAGVHRGGTVLMHGPGMDEPGLHVATSRRKDRMYLFAGREQVESMGTAHEKGAPVSEVDLRARVVAALAEQARTRAASANDTPVLDDLGRAPQRPPGPQPAPSVRTPEQTRSRLQDLAARLPGRTRDPAAVAAEAAAREAAVRAAEAAAKREALRRDQERQHRTQGPRGPRQR